MVRRACTSGSAKSNALQPPPGDTWAARPATPREQPGFGAGTRAAPNPFSGDEMAEV